MIVVRITKGPRCGTSMVGPSQPPDDLFVSLLATDSEWEIDYSEATLQERNDWLSKDLFNRCSRALCVRKLPVFLKGEQFDDFEEFKDRYGSWFTNTLKFEVENTVGVTIHSFHGSYASALSLVKDDETGVQIERNGYAKQYSIYKDSIQARSEFRRRGLSEEHFLDFFQDELQEKMSQGSNAEVDDLLDYAEQYGCRVRRAFLTSLLTSVIEQGTDRKLVWRVRELIRTARP